MYKVSLFNDNVETIIHFPSSDSNYPHLNKLSLTEELSVVYKLSFTLYKNKQGYDNVSELTTIVKIMDTTDNTIRFTGRILEINEQMDSNGIFFKYVTCEGALIYLNDTKQRNNTFITTNVIDFLTQILNIHNSKVNDDKKILVGNVDVVGGVSHTCNFNTTLAEILSVKDKIGGDIKIRETDGLLYLDWMQSFSSDTIEVTLGVNMKDMIRKKDITSIGTRIIPLGANNLTISNVNGGLDYIEDLTAVGKYGVIEKTVEYKDITDDTELYNTCLADLNNHTQPSYLLESNAIDMSFLSGSGAKRFALGTNLHLINPIMGVDNIYKIVSLDLDLLKPYNPNLTIANTPTKLTTTLNDLRKTSIQNNGVYNGVQVGDSFGIRTSSSDGKIVTTLNATDGISIENLIKNIKVFYVDTEGNIIHDGKQQVTHNGKLLIQNWKNARGGVSKIYDNNGNLNVKIGSESGSADNVGGTLILYNDSPYDDTEDSKPYKRVEAGIDKEYDSGLVILRDSEGKQRVGIYAENTGNSAIMGLFDVNGNPLTYLTESIGKIDGETIATREWVTEYFFSMTPTQ